MTRPVDLGVDLGVDLAAVVAWLREEGVADGPVGAVTPLGGGTQNVMLRLDVGGREAIRGEGLGAHR